LPKGKINMSNLPTIQSSDDGWGAAAAENAARVIKGTLLKFSDWRWTKGKEGIEVKNGTQLVALSTAAGWVKWANNKPVEYRMREPGRALPERQELGDLDQSEWEIGPNGEPKDPWQNTRFVYLIDPLTAEAYTFSTPNWGGRQAVNDLAEQIQRKRYGRPGAVPLVELQAEPHQTKYGRKSKPVFKVIDWRSGAPRGENAIEDISSNEDHSAPALAGRASAFAGAAPALTAAASTETASAFDDEIPF
jgi:hypothetical protein